MSEFALWHADAFVRSHPSLRSLGKGLTQRRLIEDLTTLIDEVSADAWDEGHRLSEPHSDKCEPTCPNPHKSRKRKPKDEPEPGGIDALSAKDRSLIAEVCREVWADMVRTNNAQAFQDALKMCLECGEFGRHPRWCSKHNARLGGE